MSREEDDTRQYKCLRKYEAIVKQVCGTSVFRFDELINMVDARVRRPPKRRRMAVSPSTSTAQPGSAIGTSSAAAAPSRQPGGASIDEVFVQTITRFLHELNTSTPAHRDHDGSSNANED